MIQQFDEWLNLMAVLAMIGAILLNALLFTLVVKYGREVWGK